MDLEEGEEAALAVQHFLTLSVHELEKVPGAEAGDREVEHVEARVLGVSRPWFQRWPVP